MGVRRELGRCRPDSLGRLTYRSLLDRVPESHRPVGNVREVVTAGGAVYFGAQSGVLRWTGGDMTALTDTTAWALWRAAILPMCGCGGELLHRVADLSLVPVSGAQVPDSAVLADVLPAPRWP